jgi:hypothetical protein
MSASDRVGSMTFRFPYIPPGSNQLHRMHHQEVARWRRTVRRDTGRLLRRAPAPIDPALISLDFRWRTGHKRDPLNYVEATKAIVDELVRLGWLVDDDASHLGASIYGQVGTGEPDHIIVTLEASA